VHALTHNHAFRAILNDERPTVRRLLKAEPELALGRVNAARLYQSKIHHWIYVGDSPLHLAAAGYRVELVQLLLDAGADPNGATNHRRSGALHYAADGYVNGPDWNAKRQVQTLQRLLDAGAEINAQDKNGAAPLHRAVRTRCAAAVKYLLVRGSDATLKNKPVHPFHLAVQDTGRGRSGQVAGRAKEIIREFLSSGLAPALRTQRAKQSWNAPGQLERELLGNWKSEVGSPFSCRMALWIRMGGRVGFARGLMNAADGDTALVTRRGGETLAVRVAFSAKVNSGWSPIQMKNSSGRCQAVAGHGDGAVAMRGW
jgi:hypothetical protein